ncbi:putative capsid protein [Avon-Heathcote Estuary associated circular virus 22]|uniref:putative capsid protein n=1 Tax=Avon-Heathcote Estuary associated circular virus 22 TaxID=1618246 RepID=UPI0005CCE0A4|nr:putative capsid protein [Avon-Heathcote Estuary associated circular virus 22]AJP36453.1 putative capsid protein [Avon-Heathcote Estuary associated circular virus 22]AJP36456.1 putative capsid protein [Avon-Heathcote Estuary associated circular virus 22]
MAFRKFFPRKKTSGRKATTPAKRRTAKALPSRFPSGRKTYRQTRAVTRVLKNISETKIQALTPQNAITPSPVEVAPTLGPVFFTNFCLGTAPSAWVGPSGSAAFNNLNGFVWPLGSGAAQRNGQYIYLKKTALNLRVAMNASSRHGPCKFRVVVYKERRNLYNVSGGGNPCDNLFISQTGDSVGFNTISPVAQRTMDFNTWLVNKRNYQVVKDMKFVLAPETLSALGSTDPFNVNKGYTSSRDIRLSLGHFQKAKFGDDNTPEDQMYRYCISVISMPMSSSEAPHSDYKTYVNGVVSCIDN